MRMKKGFLLLCAFILILAVAGCSSTKTSKDAKDNVITLEFWKQPGLPTKEEKEMYVKLIKKFEEENPNIKVKHTIVPWDGALEKYTAAFTTDDAPDVAYQILPWINNFRGQNALKAIDDIGDPNEVLQGVYPEVAKGAKGPEDGKYYGIPYYGSMWVLAINEDVWEKAGKPEIPKTYEDLIPFAQKLTFDKNGNHPGDPGFDKKNIDIYGWMQTGKQELLVNYMWNYFWAYGVDYISEDGKDIGFNNSKGREALKVMKAMVDSGAATPLNLYPNSDATLEAFQLGKIGMSWFERPTQSLLDENPNMRIKVIDIPEGPAGQYAVGGAGYLSIPAKSKHPKEALKFIQFITKEENVKDYLRTTKLHPVKDMGKDLYSGIGPGEDFMNEAVGQGKFMKLSRVGLPYSPDEVIIGEINNYLTGQEKLDSMLKNLSKQVKLMAQNAGMK